MLASPAQLNISISAAAKERLDSLSKSLSISRSKFMECLIMQDEKAIAEIVNKTQSIISEARAQARTANTEKRHAFKKGLKSVPKDVLEALIAQHANEKE